MTFLIVPFSSLILFLNFVLSIVSSVPSSFIFKVLHWKIFYLDGSSLLSMPAMSYPAPLFTLECLCPKAISFLSFRSHLKIPLVHMTGLALLGQNCAETRTYHRDDCQCIGSFCSPICLHLLLSAGPYFCLIVVKDLEQEGHG